MKIKNQILSILFLCSTALAIAQKFEPKTGNCLVFVGQDLEAVGGLKDYNKGYVDYFNIPPGVTIYTNLSPNNESYGYYNKGLDGIKTKVNWGAGDNYANLYLQDSTFKNSAIAIGLSFVNHEKEVSKGQLDNLIIELANWIQESKRPIFLRVGYEFDGWEWNHYKKKHYLKAWERIHNIFRKMQIDNVTFVWQSKGTGSNQDILEAWYPGDEIVDWCAYSYFGQADQEMLTFARKHNKPVFIAEATPVRQMENLYFETDLKKETQAEAIWEEWYVPFFKTIKNNSDVIKAFSYINTDWYAQPMWITNPVFKNVDSRLQMSKYISKKWTEEIQKSHYLHAENVLWNELSKE